MTDILQDSRGFMWFGTWEGLNKFDGYEFTVYRHDPDDPYSLSDNIVSSVFEDTSGVLWVGTDGGLNRFDTDNERFVRYQHDPDDDHSLSHNIVSHIVEDSSGVLWIATWGGGLNRFDRKAEQFVHYRHDPDDVDSLGHDIVTSVFEDASGELWIATPAGLDKFDSENERFVHFRHEPDDPHSLSSDRAVAVFQDRTGEFWVGTGGGGLNKFDPVTMQFIHFRHDPDDVHSLSSDVVRGIYEDLLGTLWILTDDGLNRFDRENERFIRYQHDPDDPQSLGDSVVNAIYQDRSGVIWVGTGDAGISIFDPSAERFVHYQHDPENPNSLSDNMVWSIVQDEEGVLWIGTEGGLNRFDREPGQWRHYQHDPDDVHSLSSNAVLSLLLDREGVLWIGTDNGLDQFDQAKEQFIHYRHDPDDAQSLSNDLVTVICEDQAGDLWIGTYGGGGLNQFDRATGKFIRYPIAPDDPHSLSNGVWEISEGAPGTLWIGTRGGLVRFDKETAGFSHYQHRAGKARSLSDDRVLVIHRDRAGTLWIGTFGGLNKFDPETETFTHYRVKDGLPNDVIYGILEDDVPPDQGGPFLWLSTNKGLSRFDPRTETFKNFGRRDGVQSNEFNSNAYHKGSSGEMFFGGVNGLNAFFPEEIGDNPFVPPVVVVSFTQSGEDIDPGTAEESLEEVTFHWPNNFFEFEFAALSYSQPEENQYAYMLEGFDKDWNYTGTRRFGRYTNLPGGTYTLRIKGSNNDGVWNEEGASIKVTVVPPFWETWWFRGILLFGLIGTVAGGVQVRVRSIATRNRELEKQVEERTQALEQRTNELQERTHELEKQTQALERRGKELEALYRADKRMHRHLHLDQVLQALVDVAVDILQADKSAVLVWDERRERLETRVARGFTAEAMSRLTFARGQGITGRAAESGELATVEDSLNDPRRADERPETLHAVDAEGIRSFMHIPIIVNDAVFGVFNVSFMQPHAFGEDEERLFVALAQRAALAIENAQLYEQTQELAIVEERSRLARDLHDAVTQTLFSASLIAEALPALWESDQQEGRELLRELRQLSRGALAEMRSLLMELRPAALVEASLDDLLRQLGEAVTGRTSIPVTVRAEGRCELPSDVHVALYRIAQEAVNNVVKHAHASRVEIRLRCSCPADAEGHRWSGVELRVSDDGRGFDPSRVPPERLGLRIVRERAQAIGAGLRVDSQPGQGTVVGVVWEDEEREEQ